MYPRQPLCKYRTESPQSESYSFTISRLPLSQQLRLASFRASYASCIFSLLYAGSISLGNDSLFATQLLEDTYFLRADRSSMPHFTMCCEEGPVHTSRPLSWVSPRSHLRSCQPSRVRISIPRTHYIRAKLTCMISNTGICPSTLQPVAYYPNRQENQYRFTAISCDSLTESSCGAIVLHFAPTVLLGRSGIRKFPTVRIVVQCFCSHSNSCGEPRQHRTALRTCALSIFCP